MATDRNNAPVVPFMRVVANGVAEDGTLRATLIVTPQPVDDDGKFQLATWPLGIVKELGISRDAKGRFVFKLDICTSDPCTGGTVCPADAWFRVALEERPEVVALWQSAIEGDRHFTTPWRELHEDIRRSMSGEKHSAQIQPVYAGSTASVPDGKQFSDTGVIIAKSYDPTQTFNVKGVVSNTQAKFATETEAARAQRVATKLVNGPFLPGDQDHDDNSTTQIAQESSAADVEITGSIPDVNPDADLKAHLIETKRQLLFDRLKAAIDDTQPDRENSHKSFGAVQAYLADPHSSPSQTPPVFESQSVVTSNTQVHGSSNTKDRASHIYGAWTQRSSAASPRAADVDDDTCADPDAVARIHGVYYSLQGDPILSRFFGFAFDLEFNCPEDMAAGAKLWLAPSNVKDRVWTKALYQPGLYKKDPARFWPAPRFDGKHPGAALAVEQTHGVHDLGLGYDQDESKRALRYDLTSLDVRAAVSGARDAQDRGQRQHTIGWTLLDRGRADQVARDLAIYDYQTQNKACGNEVVLHAEELTIGRRLDVAVAADGAPVDKLHWRGLMNRFVEFPTLSGGVKEHLEKVIADRKYGGKILDESSFQLMARAMPLVNAEGVEAVVEEAIQTWDGTPLGALACKSDESKCQTAILPIKRTYDLPREPFPHLRPPPLRFGVGYVFSIRSVFLGGGSPTVDEAGSLHAAIGGAWTLPPSDNEKARPRRYLRHEPIGAPILMLPACLIAKTNGAMGFEPPGQAVLRTATPTDHSAPQPCLTQTSRKMPAGPHYVTPAMRANLEMTTRIFIAPMVGFDFASRHRVFDDSKRADEVLQGGLRDVELEPEKPQFPVALVKRNTGFNGEKLVYGREIGSPPKYPDEDSDGLGATVFRPKASKDRKPGLGYLPDPAAECMSVRLRICGADNYLDGDVSVDLYAPNKGINYPHALPLAVTIEKTGLSQRKILANKISDVVSGDTTAIMRIGEDGRVVPDAAGKGVRVRHLKITLAPGEQFDLEVTCIPSVSKLMNWFSLPETMGVQHLAALKIPAVREVLIDCCGSALLAEQLEEEGSRPAKRSGLAGQAPPDHSGISLISRTLLDCIQNKWSLTELAAASNLRVIHAVNAPQGGPSLESVSILRPSANTIASVGPHAPASIMGDPKSTPQLLCSDVDYVRGSTSVLLSGEILVDLEQTDTIEVIATVVNASGKRFDDASRQRGILAKRTGRWPQKTLSDGSHAPVPNRTVFGFDVDADGKVELLREVITLLRIQSLPDPRAALNPDKTKPQPFIYPSKGRLSRLDLRVLHAAAISGGTLEIPIAIPKGAAGPTSGDKVTPRTRIISVTRPHELTDTKARELKLHAVAFSRFAGTFETAPMFSDDGEEHVLHRRQPLQPQDQSRTGEAKTAWSLSTERPASCAAKTPTLFIAMKRSARNERNGVAQILDRECGVRLRFDRGMFSSGEGERIAVVLWPPNIRDQSPVGFDQNRIDFEGRRMELSDFDDADLGDGGKFVSRWGGDPIRSDLAPQKGFFMPWSAFDFIDEQNSEKQPHQPRYVPTARMPVSAPTTGDDKAPPIEGYLEVALLTFEPYFDLDREEWFVDMPIKLARATDPFIRLGLVRYQPNSICDDLKVSTPVRVWTQLPPHRRVKVSHETINADVCVLALVRGQASDGIKPLPDELQYLLDDADGKKIWERLQRPKMTLKLVHEAAETKFGRHQTSILSGQVLSAAPNPVDGEMEWELNATIPAARLKDLGTGKIFAIVEEVEERLAASYAQEPLDLAKVLSAGSIQESGPRFLARIPFLEV